MIGDLAFALIFGGICLVAFVVVALPIVLAAQARAIRDEQHEHARREARRAVAGAHRRLDRVALERHITAATGRLLPVDEHPTVDLAPSLHAYYDAEFAALVQRITLAKEA